MDNGVASILIPAIVGLITGSIGSLIAPWVTWGVEKRRLRRQDRKELLESARKVLTEEMSGQDFVQTAEWSRLRSLIAPKLREQLEGKSIICVIGGGRGNVTIWILDEISRIEQKWKLV